MYEEPTSYSANNRQALFSLLLAVLALLSFCIGAAPLPMTALVCYPSSVLLGIGALWTGVKALQQIRQNNERGHVLAKIGIWIGSLTILFVICAVTLAILLWPYIFDLLQSFWYELTS
jgi:hypothetical protein